MQTQLISNGYSSSVKWKKILFGIVFAPSFLMPFIVPLMPLTAKSESGYRCHSSFKQVTQGSPLQVFESPDIGTRNVGELTEGTKVLGTLSDRSGLFREVQTLGGTQGWVLSSRLSSLSSEVRRFNGFLQVKTLDGGRVNMRESAWLKAKIVGKLPSGNVVRFGHNEGEWSYVTDSLGTSGYIAYPYLVCTTAKFNLRDGPDRN
jgi:uncharacterized protein YgiM (DUF1202 family)